jgi:hypothetical protein
MTFDSLVLNVQQYMERTDADFVAQIPSLIALAESRIASELKTLLQLTVVETTLATNQVILNKPARWRKTVSMKVNGAPIVMRSQDYVAMYQSESEPGTPQFYAEYDYNNFAIAPAPSTNSSVEIIYYSEIQPLDDENQQNLFTRETPQLMLYGTLLAAQGYLKALDKLPVWKGYYDDTLAAIKKEDNTRRIDRNTTIQEP